MNAENKEPDKEDKDTAKKEEDTGPYVAASSDTVKFGKQAGAPTDSARPGTGSPGTLTDQIEIVFPELKKATVQEFKKLPATTSKTPEETNAVTWRIVLVSSRPSDTPITAEIRDDVTIGRATNDTPVDIDLMDFGAGEKGVSRQHAMLHPTRDELLLRDLGSTNGTYCGSERASLGHSLPVRDGDVVRLGGLYMKMFIVHKPA